jgi:NADPH2:quinone reductase
MVLKLGHAKDVLSYKQEDLVRAVEDVTQGHGVDVVFDGIGKATLDIDLAVLRRKGTLVMHGTASGVPENFKIGCLTPKNIKFLKPTFMNYLSTREEVISYSSQIFEALEKSLISVHIHKEYPLAEVQKAHQVMFSHLFYFLFPLLFFVSCDP